MKKFILTVLAVSLIATPAFASSHEGASTGMKVLDAALDGCELSADDARRLIADGTIAGGMIPKVQTALFAMAKGCGGAVILDGTTPHGVLLELFTNHNFIWFLCPQVVKHSKLQL